MIKNITGIIIKRIKHGKMYDSDNRQNSDQSYVRLHTLQKHHRYNYNNKTQKMPDNENGRTVTNPNVRLKKHHHNKRQKNVRQR